MDSLENRIRAAIAAAPPSEELAAFVDRLPSAPSSTLFGMLIDAMAVEGELLATAVGSEDPGHNARGLLSLLDELDRRLPPRSSSGG